MKKYAYSLVGAFLCLLISSHDHAATESIRNFDVYFYVQENGEVRAAERIVYDFTEGAVDKHGLERILLRNEVPGSAYKIDYEDFDVRDHYGEPYDFNVYKDTESELIYRIGSADTTVSGIKEYNISYAMTDAIGYFKEFDEFYINAIGLEWKVPIESATVSFELPSKVKPIDVKVYCGYKGRKMECAKTITNYFEADDMYTVDLDFDTSIFPLPPGYGVTVSFQKNPA